MARRSEGRPAPRAHPSRRQEERRIDRRGIQIDAEVQVGAGHATGRADAADLHAGIDGRADAVSMRTGGSTSSETPAVVDDHGVAVEEVVAGVGHWPAAAATTGVPAAPRCPSRCADCATGH